MICERPAFAMLILAAAVARGGIKVERVPVDPDKQPLFSLSTHDLSSADTVAAFRQQTGIDIVVEPSMMNASGGPAVVYDLNFTDLTRADAIKELARTLGLGINRGVPGPVRLSPNSWSDEAEHRDTPAVTIAVVTRNQSLPVSPQSPDGLTVQFRIFGGRRALDGPVTVALTDARDDQGRPVTPFERGPRPTNDGAPDQFTADVPVRFQTDGPPPVSLSVLRGTATVMRPKTLLRVSVDAFPETPLEADYDGATLRIGPPAPSTEGFDLPIAFTRGTMDPEHWQALSRRVVRLSQSISVKGPDGQPLQWVVRQWSQGSDTLGIKAVVVRAPAGQFGPPPGPALPAVRPATLRMENVVDTTAETIPFEFKDIAVP